MKKHMHICQQIKGEITAHASLGLKSFFSRHQIYNILGGGGGGGGMPQKGVAKESN